MLLLREKNNILSLAMSPQIAGPDQELIDADRWRPETGLEIEGRNWPLQCDHGRSRRFGRYDDA
jgi:hypothetical protein